MPADEPTTERLRAIQAEREADERGRESEASEPAEERAARRRADKAAYLKSKLEEQARNQDDPA